MVAFDFSLEPIQIVGLVLVVVIVPLGIWNMKRIQRKKLEEEEQFAAMGSQEITDPSEPVSGGQNISSEPSEAELPLKTYIEQYKSQYSKEALRSALLKNGNDQALVDTCLEKYF